MEATEEAVAAVMLGRSANGRIAVGEAAAEVVQEAEVGVAAL